MTAPDAAQPIATAPPHLDGRFIDAYLTRDGLDRLFSLLVRPHKYTVRVIETLEDKQTHIERHTGLELSSGGVPHFVPIAQPLRGTLVDTLKIDATSNVQDSVLGRTDTLAVIQTVMTLAARNIDVDCSDPLVIQFTRVAQLGQESGYTLFHTLRRMRRLDADHVPDSQKILYKLANDSTFFQLFRFFYLHQLLLVPCTPASTFFKVSYTAHVGQSRYRGKSVSERTRKVLGLAPYRLRIEIPLALTAQSYHLRMRSPLQHYTRRVELLATHLSITEHPQAVRDGELRRIVPAGTSVRAAYRQMDPDGLTHIHTQNLSLATNRPRRLFAAVLWDERPLGQLAGAILRLSIVLLSILLAKSMAEGLIAGQSALLSAILIALPAILGVSSLMSAELGRIFSPVAARVGSVFASASAVVATFTLVSWVSSKAGCFAASKCDTSMPDGVATSFLLIETALWVVIAWCAVALLINVVRYSRGAKGPPSS